jgi:N-acetylmuramoyl-L-alanine amidase
MNIFQFLFPFRMKSLGSAIKLSSFYSMLVLACFSLTAGQTFAFKKNPLAGKTICVDAGHGGTSLTDNYRKGITGEREEWVNLRVALLLQKMLEEKGAKVIMTRTGDDFIPLAERAKLATENKADLFLSIHHNATADSNVNFPIIYYHGHTSENAAGVALGKHIAKAFKKNFYNGKAPVSLVSDHTIFASGGAGVLRGTYGIPGVLSEASFFTNPSEEQRLKAPEHNMKEASAYLAALEAFFAETPPAILPRNSLVSMPPFRGLQEADRMSEIARRWYQDFQEGEKLSKRKDSSSIRQAYDLFTRSARSFPDSYVAAECHQKRALMLKKLGKVEEAQQEEKRVKEFYVKTK